jgi:hypothetical protein
MKYFGIKTPETPTQPSYIWWITDSEWNSWQQFFRVADKLDENKLLKFDLYSAEQAYQAIGYRCVELELSVVREITREPKIDDLLLRYPNLNHAVSILIEGLKNNDTYKSEMALYDWDKIRGYDE